MKITNKLGLPAAFVDAATSDHKYTPKRYSATALLKGAREVILQRRHADEIETDVADCVWMILGSAVHKIIEQAQEGEHELKEEYITVDMHNGYTLSGIFDSYNDATGTVVDWKTASVFKVTMGDWEDYRKQVLIYCWILRQMGFDAHTGEVVALLKDHSSSKAKYDSSYPQHPVHIERWEFTENDFDEIGAWLEHKFLEIEAAEKLPDDELPVCTEEQRWASPAKYAVYKNANKKATKLFDTEEDAQKFITFHGRNSKDKFRVEYRPGADRKCESYCSVCEFCNYYNSNAN